MQVRRTLTVGATPTGLAEGQISVGMADQPPIAWVGVPASVNPAGVIPITGLVRTVAGAPQPAGALGQLWWDEDAAQLFVYTGSEWVVAVNSPIPDLSQFLPLTGGTLTGPLTINAAPTSLTLSNLMYATSIIASGGVFANNFQGQVVAPSLVAFNGAASTTSPTDWAAANAGVVATLNTQQPSLRLQVSPNLAAGQDVPSWATFVFDSAGQLTTPGNIICNGAGVRFQGGNAFSASWNNYSWVAYVDGILVGPLVTGDNTAVAGLAGGMGGPTGVALYHSTGDKTTNYYALADVASDERIKRNIEPTAIDALAAVNAVPVTQYDIRADAVRALSLSPAPGTVPPRPQPIVDTHVPIGVVAQQAQPFIPEMVTVARQPEGHSPALPTDLHNVVFQQAVPYLIRAIQQLTARVAELEAKA